MCCKKLFTNLVVVVVVRQSLFDFMSYVKILMKVCVCVKTILFCKYNGRIVGFTFFFLFCFRRVCSSTIFSECVDETLIIPIVLILFNYWWEIGIKINANQNLPFVIFKSVCLTNLSESTSKDIIFLKDPNAP